MMDIDDEDCERSHISAGAPDLVESAGASGVTLAISVSPASSISCDSPPPELFGDNYDMQYSASAMLSEGSDGVNISEVSHEEVLQSYAPTLSAAPLEFEPSLDYDFDYGSVASERSGHKVLSWEELWAAIQSYDSGIAHFTSRNIEEDRFVSAESLDPWRSLAERRCQECREVDALTATGSRICARCNGFAERWCKTVDAVAHNCGKLQPAAPFKSALDFTLCLPRCDASGGIIEQLTASQNDRALTDAYSAAGGNGVGLVSVHRTRGGLTTSVPRVRHQRAAALPGCVVCGFPKAASHYSCWICAGCRREFSLRVVERYVESVDFLLNVHSDRCDISTAPLRRKCPNCRFMKFMTAGLRADEVHLASPTVVAKMLRISRFPERLVRRTASLRLRAPRKRKLASSASASLSGHVVRFSGRMSSARREGSVAHVNADAVGSAAISPVYLAVENRVGDGSRAGVTDVASRSSVSQARIDVVLPNICISGGSVSECLFDDVYDSITGVRTVGVQTSVSIHPEALLQADVISKASSLPVFAQSSAVAAQTDPIGERIMIQPCRQFFSSSCPEDFLPASHE